MPIADSAHSPPSLSFSPFRRDKEGKLATGAAPLPLHLRLSSVSSCLVLSQMSVTASIDFTPPNQSIQLVRSCSETKEGPSLLRRRCNRIEGVLSLSISLSLSLGRRLTDRATAMQRKS